MKATLISDLIVSKAYLIQQLVLSVAVALFMTIALGEVYASLPILGISIPFALIFSIVAFDDRNDWESYRLTMPVSRAQIIAGRYMTGVLIILVAVLIALASLGLCVPLLNGIDKVMPLDGGLMEQLAHLNWQIILALCVAASSFSLLLLSITFPYTARFGLTKALRYIPLALFGLGLIGVFAVQAVGIDPSAPALQSFISWVSTPSGTLLACLGAVLLLSTVYVISYVIALRLYATKEL